LMDCWGLSIVGAIGGGFRAHRLLDEFSWRSVLFGGLFAVWWLVGSRWYGEASRVWQRPFQIVGGLGLWVMSLVLTFSDPWEEVSRHVWWGHMHHNPAEWIGALVWPVAAVALWVAAWRRREVSELLLGAMPVLAVIGQALAVHDMEVAAAVLFNVYVLVVAVTLIASGVKVQRLGIINAGMLLLSALILCRFFDADLGFVARGIAFILVGTGFLVTNLVLLRRKGAAQ